MFASKEKDSLLLKSIYFPIKQRQSTTQYRSILIRFAAGALVHSGAKLIRQLSKCNTTIHSTATRELLLNLIYDVRNSLIRRPVDPGFKSIVRHASAHTCNTEVTCESSVSLIGLSLYIRLFLQTFDFNIQDKRIIFTCNLINFTCPIIYSMLFHPMIIAGDLEALYFVCF